MPEGINEVKIEQVRSHWEVHIDGEFFCSADSYTEALNELFDVYKHRHNN